MTSDKTPYVILVDGTPHPERYSTANAALKAALRLTWIAESKIEILKAVQSINVEETL